MKIKKENEVLLGFNDFWFIIIGVPILGFLIPLIFFNMPLDFHSPILYQKWLESSIYALANWLISRYLILYFRKKLPNEQDTFKRISLVTLAYLLLSNFVGVICINSILQHFVIFNTPNPSFLQGNIATITCYITIASIYESVFFFSKWKHSLIKTEELKKEIMKTHINSLRAQVNPHFLFNSLNALSNLIQENPQTAIQFTEKLSQTYRYILQMSDTELICLEDELQFLEAYKFLNEERFSDSLSININVDAVARKKLITPLTLQILVENAIKHNIVSKSKPLFVEIFVQDNNIIVKNNLQLKTTDIVSTGTGLKNIEKRYSFITTIAIDVIQTNEHFVVVLPLIELSKTTA